MPADQPRFDENPVPKDTPTPAPEDKVDLIALEEEAVELEGKELAEAERRAADLCRAVQRGKVDKDFLEENEIDPGHTMERHVGKDDEYLRARKIPRASTFTDLASAERAIAHVLRTRSSDIDKWRAQDQPGDAILDLDVGWTAGRVRDGDGSIRPSSKVRVILMPIVHGYRLRTAYVM